VVLQHALTRPCRIIPATPANVLQIQDPFCDSGTLREGCHAATFMDK